jgi:two-component system C4-dicarboxylate transport sensor histidine kinase DctB
MTLRRVLSLFVLAARVAAGAAFAVTYRIALREIEGRLDQSLILTRRAIESEIERFRYLPGVAAEDARIAAAIRAPQSPAAIAEANRYLAVVAAKSGADTLYLLNSDGLAIAASNWATPQTFIGGRYDFRPYFTDAMHAGRGRFYAIGVTTGQPGYFISTRVDLAGGGIGVMVVKINLEPLQRTWQSAGVRTSIADQDGVVFLTAEPGWLYAPLAPLPAVGAARITRNRTYSGVDVAAIPPLSRGAVEASGMAMRAASGQRLWARATRMQDDGWTVISAAPVAGAIWAAALWAMGAALVAMAGAGVGMILSARSPPAPAIWPAKSRRAARPRPTCAPPRKGWCIPKRWPPSAACPPRSCTRSASPWRRWRRRLPPPRGPCPTPATRPQPGSPPPAR